MSAVQTERAQHEKSKPNYARRTGTASGKGTAVMKRKTLSRERNRLRTKAGQKHRNTTRGLRFDELANLPFTENRPTKETAQTLRDELLFQRATQTYQMLNKLDEPGIADNTIVLYSTDRPVRAGRLQLKCLLGLDGRSRFHDVRDASAGGGADRGLRQVPARGQLLADPAPLLAGSLCL
jgi:hypothetical protein